MEGGLYLSDQGTSTNGAKRGSTQGRDLTKGELYPIRIEKSNRIQIKTGEIEVNDEVKMSRQNCNWKTIKIKLINGCSLDWLKNCNPPENVFSVY